MKTATRQSFLESISGITRQIDLRLMSNQFAVLVTMFALFLIAGIILFFPGHFSEHILAIPKVAVYVFLVWALAREYDPDSVFTSYLAPVLSLTLLVLFPVSLSGVPLVFLLVLLLARIVSRSTGRKVTVFDSGAVLILTAMVTLALQNWIVPLFASISFLFDFLLSRSNRISGVFSLLAALMSLASIWVYGAALGEKSLPTPYVLGIFISSVVFVLLSIGFNADVTSVTDSSNTRLDKYRMKAARFVLLWVAVTLSLQNNLSGLVGYSGLWILIIIIPLSAVVSVLNNYREGEEPEKSG
ncbi:MAG: hypothetical protein TR69_WS6001000107 [candidate division WS6 bacterium OLB20]|uniref:Uncharacterized protein n=1 Tax=candidate division WS6 bacterium OLB20 TaxID=1617426 RepID=A0A136M002_9BACT|nr:MAG: hypothetical protein TR69_WS6001000107 [candidate division WS6 bacterium OLB20]